MGWPAEFHLWPKWLAPALLAGFFALGASIAAAVDVVHRHRSS